MKIFSKVREFFWPLLEKEPIAEPKTMEIDDIVVSRIHLEKTLDYALKCYEAENERNKTVEGKSSLFIGTTSVITSIIIGVTSVLTKNNEFDNSITLLVILQFLLVLYMARTIWFSIKALERKSYHVISITDFLINDADDNYFKKLIAEITNKLKKNSITINSKVDNMTMAQEYFKRSIVIVIFYALVILLVFISRLDINNKSTFANTDGSVNKLVMVFAEEHPAIKHSNCMSLHPDSRTVRMLNPAPHGQTEVSVWLAPRHCACGFDLLPAPGVQPWLPVTLYRDYTVCRR